MQRTADPGRCPQGQRHPSPIGKRVVDPEEFGHVALRVSAQTGSPPAIARANGTSASSANRPHRSSSSSE